MLTLTEEEIREITQRKRPKFQKAVLKALGIRFQERPDGSLLVYRRYVDKTDTITNREPQMRLRNGQTAQV